MRSGGFHYIDGCMRANAVVYDYMKCPKLYNGASVRRNMFADICDVKSRQPFRKTTSSTMTFFGRPFSSACTLVNQKRMLLNTSRTVRTATHTDQFIHRLPQSAVGVCFLRSGGFHSIDRCMRANAVVYDTWSALNYTTESPFDESCSPTYVM